MLRTKTVRTKGGELARLEAVKGGERTEKLYDKTRRLCKYSTEHSCCWWWWLKRGLKRGEKMWGKYRSTNKGGRERERERKAVTLAQGRMNVNATRQDGEKTREKFSSLFFSLPCTVR